MWQALRVLAGSTLILISVAVNIAAGPSRVVEPAALPGPIQHPVPFQADIPGLFLGH
jgi:hypothetical protein